MSASAPLSTDLAFSIPVSVPLSRHTASVARRPRALSNFKSSSDYYYYPSTTRILPCASLPDSNGKKETNSRNNANECGSSEEEQRASFHWPWQNGKSTSNAQQESDSSLHQSIEPNFEYQPPDAKADSSSITPPNSDTLSDVASEMNENREKSPWQDKLISIIAPGFAEKGEEKDDKSAVAEEEAAKPQQKRISSILELYKPPPKKRTDAEKEQREPWIKWPVKREKTAQSSEASVNRKAAMKTPSKNGKDNSAASHQSREQPEKENEAFKWPWKKAEKEVVSKEESGGKEDKSPIKWPWRKNEGNNIEAKDDNRRTSEKDSTVETEKDGTNEQGVSGLPRKPAVPKRTIVKAKLTTTVSDSESDSERKSIGIESSEDEIASEKKQESSVAVRSQNLVQRQSQPPTVDTVTIPQRDIATIRLIFGSETFFATETLSAPGGLVFRGNLRGEPNATLAKLEERLRARLGDKYTLCLAEGEEDLRPVVVVVPTARDMRPATARQKILAVAVALLTASTCVGRGLYSIMLKDTITRAHGKPAKGDILYRLFGMPSATSVTIAVSIGLCIVLSQVVQRIVAARRKTRVAIPFILPSYQLGSFGAVVQLASPTPTRSALFDIALSGAATMVVVSLVCLIVGLRLSTSLPFVVPVPMSTVSSSVVMGFLTQQIPNGKILVDYSRSLIGLHPLAVIGANCLTIAALNLLPMRQLDGGRIISALYGRKTAAAASRITVFFLLLASSKNAYLIVFLAAITFGPWNMDRPARNELSEPDGLRTIVGYVLMLLMIGVLLPFPACKFFGTL